MNHLGHAQHYTYQYNPFVQLPQWQGGGPFRGFAGSSSTSIIGSVLPGLDKFLQQQTTQLQTTQLSKDEYNIQLQLALSKALQESSGVPYPVARSYVMLVMQLIEEFGDKLNPHGLGIFFDQIRYFIDDNGTWKTAPSIGERSVWLSVRAKLPLETIHAIHRYTGINLLFVPSTVGPLGLPLWGWGVGLGATALAVMYFWSKKR